MNRQDRERLEQLKRRRRRVARIRRKKLHILYRRLAIAAVMAALFILVIAVIVMKKKEQPAVEADAGYTHGEWLAAFEEQGKRVSALLEEQKEREATVELLAVGDNLIHDRVYENLETEEGSYDFRPIYTELKEDITAADIAVVNQETVLTEDMEKISSWPAFATPAQVGDALADTGFDVVLQASNHTMDKGKDGVLGTLDFWNKNHPDIRVLGIHESEAKAEDITVVESKGIKIAMLNYTFEFNNMDSSKAPSYLADVYSREKVKQNVRMAKKSSDIVIVFFHAGQEYVDEPPVEVTEEMDYLAELGVDVTVACHPHVIQRYEMVEGNGGHQMLTYYSLGNFFSGQRRPDTLLGGMAKICFRKQMDGTVSITSYDMIPLVSHYDSEFKNARVYKLSDYTEELASAHGITKQEGMEETEFNLQYLQNRYQTITQGAVDAEET